jgi:hypothetical protein
MTLAAALAAAALAGCASSDTREVASRGKTYMPLGSNVPHKVGESIDDRKYIDKEEFRRQMEMAARK